MIIPYAFQFKVQLIYIIIQEQRRNTMTSNYFQSLQIEDKSTQLGELYERILKDLMEYIYKDNKYRHKGMDEDTIDDLQKKIRSLLRDPNRLFSLANNYKEGSPWFTTIEANIIRQDTKDLQRIALQRPHELIRNTESHKKLIAPPIDQGDSKYFGLNKNIHSSAQCLIKTEERLIQVDSLCEMIQQSSYPSSSVLQESPEINYHQFLNSRLVGRYGDRSIRYVAKNEKYMIHFTDVFLKTTEGELYLRNLFIEMIWMSKYMLPPLNS